MVDRKERGGFEWQQTAAFLSDVTVNTVLNNERELGGASKSLVQVAAGRRKVATGVVWACCAVSYSAVTHTLHAAAHKEGGREAAGRATVAWLTCSGVQRRRPRGSRLPGFECKYYLLYSVVYYTASACPQRPEGAPTTSPKRRRSPLESK
jgi:hypothetical protein